MTSKMYKRLRFLFSEFSTLDPFNFDADPDPDPGHLLIFTEFF